MCKTMTSIDYPQPNTTVARLHLSLNGDFTEHAKNLKINETINMIKELIEEDTRMPSGATIIEGTGIWYPRHECQFNGDQCDNTATHMYVNNSGDQREEIKVCSEHKQDINEANPYTGIKELDQSINQEKKEISDNIIIEIWIDSEEELNRVREFKDILETRFKQDSIPLTLKDRYCEY